MDGGGVSSTGGVRGGITNGDGFGASGACCFCCSACRRSALAPGLLGLFLHASLPRRFIGGRFRLLAFGVLFASNCR